MKMLESLSFMTQQVTSGSLLFSQIILERCAIILTFAALHTMLALS